MQQFYINPRSQGKSEYLSSNGERLDSCPSYHEIPADKALVCFIDYGHAQALGIIYSQGSYESYNQPDDLRSKEWYLVSREKLIADSFIQERNFEKGDA